MWRCFGSLLRRYDETEIRFFVTGTAVAPRLELPGLPPKFQSDPAELIATGRIDATSSIVLTNPTMGNIVCSLATQHPFSVLSTATNGRRVAADRPVDLKPGSSVEVAIGLQLTADAVAALARSQVADFGDALPNGEIRLAEVLSIRFVDGSTQRVDLQASVQTSHLELSSTDIDFGTCLVGSTAMRELTVRNTGLAHTAWDAASADPAFHCEPSSGQLTGFESHVSGHTSQIVVHYCPAAVGFFESVIEVVGRLGEHTRLVRVFGKGTHDEGAVAST